MLVPQFKLKRVRGDAFGWMAESEYEKGGRYRGFCAVGKNRADVRRFAEIVRWCERSGKIEDLARHLEDLEQETGMQSTWGGNFYNRAAGTPATGD